MGMLLNQLHKGNKITLKFHLKNQWKQMFTEDLDITFIIG